MYENRMLGVPRLRQIKTTNTSCLDTLLTDFSTAIRSVTPGEGGFNNDGYSISNEESTDCSTSSFKKI